MTTNRAPSAALSPDDWPPPEPYDELPFGEPTEPPSFTGAEGRKCRRHRWVRTSDGVIPNFGEHYGDGPDPGYATWSCYRCGAPKDEERSRRGKSARNRGNAYERELAKKLGGKRTGQFGGPDDVTVSELFVIQSKVRKAWPRWMADELAKLPRTGGRIPLLVVADAPGAGTRRRALVVVDLADWIELHGPEVA